MIILALFGASFFGIMIIAPLITFIINKFAANNKNIQALFSYITLILSLIVTIDLFQYFKDIDEEKYDTGMDATYWEISQNAYYLFTFVLITIVILKLLTIAYKTKNTNLGNLIIIAILTLLTGLILPNIIYLVMPYIIAHIISDNFNFNQYYLMGTIGIIFILIGVLTPSSKLLQTIESEAREKNIIKMNEYSEKFKEPFDNYKVNIIPNEKGNFSFTL